MMVFRKSLLLLLAGVSSLCSFAGEKEYAERLAQLTGTFRYQMVPGAARQIDTWVESKEIGRVQGRMDYFYPKLSPILTQQGIPAEMMFLAAAVSGLNDTLFIAETGTAGIWQLPYRVATTYQLKVISLVDERRDAEKSTRAFAAYARELHRMYNDWYLVMAAYLANPYQLNKAISLAGADSLSYSAIHAHLPVDAQEAIAAFTAHLYLYNYRSLHKLTPKPFFKPQRDTVLVNFEFSFNETQQLLGIPVDSMRYMNPTFRYGYVPQGPNPYKVAIPAGMYKRWSWFKDTVRSLPASPVDLEPYRIEKDTGTAAVPAAGTKVKLYYTVRSGDNSTHIADLYDCTLADLKRWNPRISWKYLKVGQKVLVYVPAEKAAVYKRINTMTPAQKRQQKAVD